MPEGGSGWVDYGDTDGSNGGRATGVDACLDSDYLKTHNGSPASNQPPGYRWAQNFGTGQNLVPQRSINACHLLGHQLSGSGSDLRNLSTCSRQANASVRGDGRIDDHMYSLEKQVRNAVDSGEVVRYHVEPIYMGSRVVPVAYFIAAYGTDASGNPGFSLSDIVPNSLYSPKDGRWYNFGLRIPVRPRP
ncbi:hypothetical protein C7C46_30880 [Streptomyces tateyamensis]|uniref:Type VII secretion system protein EssD-like domain-containing protein n=1 Tax=Streptomyces tateyamensis TaxID=565073 RepID=A0A2V4NXR4_9ACTN|nr:hypothetical protein C7C46_30880 [Streptomyces tateyamensis]